MMNVYFSVNAGLSLAVFRILCRSMKADQVNVFVLAALVSSCGRYDSVCCGSQTIIDLRDRDYICLCPVITATEQEKTIAAHMLPVALLFPLCHFSATLSIKQSTVTLLL